MRRRASRERAGQGIVLRSCGLTWAEIAQRLGYSGRGVAERAVTYELRRTSPESPATARRFLLSSARDNSSGKWPRSCMRLPGMRRCGSWRATGCTVARSDELAEGDVRSFDLGSVNGFVRRVEGRVEAVSGVCTHQGCRLWFDQPTDRLRCPCHVTSFSLSGQVLAHQLAIAPNPLPHYEVREHAGVIEVLAPVKST